MFKEGIPERNLSHGYIQDIIFNIKKEDLEEFKKVKKVYSRVSVIHLQQNLCKQIYSSDSYEVFEPFTKTSEAKTENLLKMNQSIRKAAEKPNDSKVYLKTLVMLERNGIIIGIPIGPLANLIKPENKVNFN